jgi:hypothetical protein
MTGYGLNEHRPDHHSQETYKAQSGILHSTYRLDHITFAIHQLVLHPLATMYLQLAALLVGPALALPATVPNTHSFQVKQVPSGKVYVSGPIQLAKTYGKYAHVGAVVPSDVKAAAAAAQSGSVAANPEDVSYNSDLLTFKIGHER